nr:hypothetical protein [uncultured Flavobacterium sp.]
MTHLKYIFIILLISCNNVNQKGKAENKCTETIKFSTLIKEVIDMPNLQQYYNIQTTIKQNRLVILKDYQFKDRIEIMKFGLSVDFLTENEIAAKKIKAYLKFEKIQIKGDCANVYFRYDIQGIGCKATYLLNDCNWKLETVHLWEN